MPGGGLGGLGGMYGGFQQAESADLDIQKKRQGNQSDQLDMAGQQALGNALKLLSGQGGPPPGMPPGQPSQPQQPPMQQGAPPGGPQPPMGGQGGPPGMPPQRGQQRPPMPPQGAPPMGGQPPGVPPTGQPGMAPPGPSQQGGPPQMGGQQRPGGQQGPALDLQSAIAAVVKSNPGAPPIVITRAIQGLVPLMNAQAQMQWREMSLQLREQALMQQQQNNQTRNQQGQERIDQGQQRVEQGGQRVEQGNRRLDQGDQKNDLAKERESRLKLKDDFNKDMQLKKLQTSLDQAVARKDAAGQRAALTAMHYRAMEMIQAASATGQFDQKTIDTMLEENRKFFREQVDAIGKAKTEGPKQQSQAPQGSPSTPGAAPIAD